MRKLSGFSLIEFIIVIALVSVVAVVANKLLATGLNAYLTGKNVIDAGVQARLALERMTRDIRAVRSPSSITTANATQFVFTDMSGSAITYAMSGTNLTRNSQILADGISSLSLTYSDSSGTTTATLASIRYITISLTVTQGGANFLIRTSVYPRNLP